MLYFIMLCYTVLFCILLEYTILIYTILFYCRLYYTILFSTIVLYIPHYTILLYSFIYYTIPYSILFYMWTTTLMCPHVIVEHLIPKPLVLICCYNCLQSSSATDGC